eukprot:COSAG03_NODE_12957_length_523_cov_1.337264_2_plen_95_part_01
MPGNEPSNGKVRQPVTIRNGSICTQKHVYEHPWELVRLCARARVSVCVSFSEILPVRRYWRRIWTAFRRTRSASKWRTAGPRTKRTTRRRGSRRS